VNAYIAVIGGSKPILKTKLRRGYPAQLEL